MLKITFSITKSKTHWTRNHQTKTHSFIVLYHNPYLHITNTQKYPFHTIISIPILILIPIPISIPILLRLSSTIRRTHGAGRRVYVHVQQRLNSTQLNTTTIKQKARHTQKPHELSFFAPPMSPRYPSTKIDCLQPR